MNGPTLDSLEDQASLVLYTAEFMCRKVLKDFREAVEKSEEAQDSNDAPTATRHLLQAKSLREDAHFLLDAIEEAQRRVARIRTTREELSIF